MSFSLFQIVLEKQCMSRKLLTTNLTRSNTPSQGPSIKIIFLENSNELISNIGKRSVNHCCFEIIRLKKAFLKIKIKAKKNLNFTASVWMKFIKDTLNKSIKSFKNQNKEHWSWESKLRNFTKSKNKERNYPNKIKPKFQLVIKMLLRRSIKFKKQARNSLKNLKLSLTILLLETIPKRKTSIWD